MGLRIGHIFEKTLRDDQIEWCAVGVDRLREEVTFDELWGFFLDCDVDPVVSDIRVKQLTKRRRSASDVQQPTVPPVRHAIHHPRHLAHAVVWLRVF